MKRSIIAFALSLALPVVALAVNSPFERLAGQWSGDGTIHMSDGNSEALRCRASYDVLSEGAGVQLAIRCAGQSYNFDLRSSAKYEGGKISGIWNESTMNTGGEISGSAKGDSIRAVANGQAFSAALTLVTNGNKQSVTIKSQHPDSKIVGASMTLSRSS